MGDTNEALINLIEWLNKNRAKTGPYTIDNTKRCFRIVRHHGGQTAVHCFVAKEDFANKTVGAVRKGDLLYPASWRSPAKHTRGSVFEPQEWPSVFGEWGMRALR